MRLSPPSLRQGTTSHRLCLHWLSEADPRLAHGKHNTNQSLRVTSLLWSHVSSLYVLPQTHPNASSRLHDYPPSIFILESGHHSKLSKIFLDFSLYYHPGSGCFLCSDFSFCNSHGPSPITLYVPCLTFWNILISVGSLGKVIEGEDRNPKELGHKPCLQAQVIKLSHGGCD